MPGRVAGRQRQAAGHDLRARGSHRRFETFIEVVDQRPAYSIVALNAPVGYLNQASAGRSDMRPRGPGPAGSARLLP